jgi:Leucine-rich repeat (LRR) protein
MLAEGSGKLDLAECELAAVPPRALDIPDLEELSLAGNQLRELPPEIGQLTGLARLQLAGNQLRSLPGSIGQLASLAGLWLHGNLLHSLPAEIGGLSSLTQLSLSGNCLEELPASLSSLAALQELSAAGNRLAELPAGLGELTALTKLHLHGNQLQEVPASISRLARLQELGLQGNPGLSFLSDQLGTLPVLRELSAADCSLAAVPASLGAAPALETLSLYGNQLRSLPPGLLQAPKLKTVWLESNPLTPEAVAALLQALPASSVTALGLDEGQLQQLPLAQREALVAAAGPKLRVSVVVPPPRHGDSASSSGAGSRGSSSHGYFKLDPAPAAAAAADNGSSRPSTEVLVVSFGSAPGTPNWGGLLKKVRAAATTPQEQNFDVLYVVDPHRSWYRGGDDGYVQYERRLRAACARYKHVVFIGDSMGATAALLFSHLATEVHAWTPQVDLATSSIRPGEGAEWQARLRQRVLDNVASCSGSITVHTGSWKHDLDQAKCLPSQPGLKVQIYSVESHRLALALDRRGALVQIVRSAVLQAMGLTNKDSIRLANLF